MTFVRVLIRRRRYYDLMFRLIAQPDKSRDIEFICISIFASRNVLTTVSRTCLRSVGSCALERNREKMEEARRMDTRRDRPSRSRRANSAMVMANGQSNSILWSRQMTPDKYAARSWPLPPLVAKKGPSFIVVYRQSTQLSVKMGLTAVALSLWSYVRMLIRSVSTNRTEVPELSTMVIPGRRLGRLIYERRWASFY